jgi:hypothetical protein
LIYSKKKEYCRDAEALRRLKENHGDTAKDMGVEERK